MKQGGQTLVRNGIVLPMDGHRTVLDPGSVLFQDQEIVAVGAVDDVDAIAAGTATTTVDATGHAIIPGLHSGHMHSGLLRGTAESLSVWEWLKTYVDPAHRALTAEIAETASRLAYTEALRFGTTSVMDMWRFMEGSARAADEIGIRATLVPYVADAPAHDYFETFESNRRLLETHRSASNGRVRTWVGLEHYYYCTPEAYKWAAQIAEEFDTGIHTHSSATITEVQQVLSDCKRRPIEELYNRGVLGPRTVLAHCVWLDDAEIQILASTGTSVVHCPCSSMKLSMGAIRLGDLRAAGVSVGLGTDGEKENNNLDLIEEMKFASLLQKVARFDSSEGDPWDVLYMATLEGARVLGLDSITGSLEAGKRADIVTVDLRQPHFVPVMHNRYFNVPAHLVFSASGHDVNQVWVDGRLLVDGGHVISVDVASIQRQAQDAAEELFERRDALEQQSPTKS